MAEPDTRNRAVALARKLLAQAEDTAATDAERQAFAAKAAEIMLRHDLTDAVVRATDTSTPSAVVVDAWQMRVSGSGGHGRHRAWGLGKIAEAYRCEVCYTGNDSGPLARTVNIVGADADLQTLRMLLPTVAAVAETSAAKATRAHRARIAREGWYTKTELDRESVAYRRSFLYNFGAGVAAQIRDRRAGIVAEVAPSGSGAELVLVDRAAKVAAEYARRYPKVGKARASRTHSVEGSRDGFRSGQALDLGGNQIGPSHHRALPQ